MRAQKKNQLFQISTDGMYWYTLNLFIYDFIEEQEFKLFIVSMTHSLEFGLNLLKII